MWTDSTMEEKNVARFEVCIDTILCEVRWFEKRYSSLLARQDDSTSHQVALLSSLSVIIFLLTRYRGSGCVTQNGKRYDPECRPKYSRGSKVTSWRYWSSRTSSPVSPFHLGYLSQRVSQRRVHRSVYYTSGRMWYWSSGPAYWSARLW